MASSFQAAVTPAGIRDGEPAALAALVERRANAVLSYCEAVCPPAAAERAAAEAFARFRAAVAAAEDPRGLDPETLLRGAARHAAAAMTVPPASGPVVGGLRGKLGAGRSAASETCALIPGLLAARADGLLGDADQERLTRHLERHAACRSLADAADRAEAAYASPLPRTVPIGALTEIMLALAAAAPITATPASDFEFADLVVAGEEDSPPETEAQHQAAASEVEAPSEPEVALESEIDAQPPESVSPEQPPEPEAYPPAPPPEPEVYPPAPPPEPEVYPPAPEPGPSAYHDAEPAPADPAEPSAYQEEAYGPASHPSAPEPGPDAYQVESYQPAAYPPAPEPGPDAYRGGASQLATYEPVTEFEPGVADTAAPSVVDDDAAHTLVFPAASRNGATAAPPGGVAHPRPPRRPLHLAGASGGHGILFRYVLPGAAVAAALVAAMGVAGVFASDEGAPPAARSVSTNVPAAPPTGAPPVMPETDVELEERTALAAQRRARRQRADAAARRRAREAAQAPAPTTSTSTVPPAVVVPEPNPDPTPAPAPAKSPKPASTVEKDPPDDSSSSVPKTGTETTPPAGPGVFEGTGTTP